MHYQSAIVAVLCCLVALSSIAAPPNFVIFLADDFSFNDLGCWGSPDAKTPHLDKLASQGVKLKRCYTAAPTCSPTRAALFTGLYPVKNGAHPNHSSVKPGTKSLAHFLKPLGYRVGIVGKTMIRPSESFPFDYLTSNEQAPKSANANRRAEKRNKKPDDLDFQAMEQYITKDDSQPFCLVVASHQPHGPWDRGDASSFKARELTMPPYLIDTPETREERTHYLAEVTFLDAEVGRVLRMLEDAGQEENTLFIFLSEQGAGLPNAKYNLYDPGIRSAAIARWPGKIMAGSENDALMSYVDVVPTLVELAGGESVPGLDGRSFANVLLGRSSEHADYVFAQATSLGVNGVKTPYAIRAVIDDRYKYIWNLNHENEFPCNRDAHGTASAWRKLAQTDPDAARRLERFLHRPEIELYDLKADPWEQVNIAGEPENRETLTRLRQQLDNWMMGQGDEGVATETAVKPRKNPQDVAKPKRKSRA